MSADAISRSQFPSQLQAAVIARRQETPRSGQWAEKIRSWERDQKKNG